MLKKPLADQIQKLFSAGDVMACENLLIDELAQLPETPFHNALDVDEESMSAGGVASDTKRFCTRQVNKSNAAMVMLELQDITTTKKWWTYSLSSYARYENLDLLHEIVEPIGTYPPQQFYGWFKVQNGFSTRYSKGAFPEAGELARHIVYMRFFRLLLNTMDKLKKAPIPIVIAPEGTSFSMEFRQGNVTTSTGTQQAATPTATDSFEARWNSICERVESYVGEETAARFSNYKRTRAGLPIDNLDAVAIRGRAIIVAEADSVWGGDDSQPYQSEVLEKPTWLELCGVLHEQIQSTKDIQHVHLEGVERTGGFSTIDGKRVSKYVLSLGS